MGNAVWTAEREIQSHSMEKNQSKSSTKLYLYLALMIMTLKHFKTEGTTNRVIT